ncbi:MAG: GLPGLI family protein [Saprospiraceae bacterium]|nr:GLPGLI family protein [Saprospiraceae bacterium]
MKKIIILFLLISPFLSVAQKPFEGVVRYLVTQNWTKKLAAVPYISKQSKERVAYMWGNRSEWKMYNTLYINANASKYENSEEKAEPDEDTWAGRKELFFMKRDFANNTMTDAMEFLGKNYLIEDQIQVFDWKIQNDLKEVAGHICMKAMTEDTLKNQTIVAWFAQDIPSSAGPDRFSGLPGLILEVDINDGAMVLTADRMDAKTLTTELDVPKKIKSKKIKYADHYEMLKKHIFENRKEENFPFWGIRY